MLLSHQSKRNLENVCSLGALENILPNETKKISKTGAVQNKKSIQIQQSQSRTIVSDLAATQQDFPQRSKQFLQYGPSFGIYVLPKHEDFFSWKFYLFLRDGYYKDAKLKGEIKFHPEESLKIQSLQFTSRVFHPFVNFQNGIVDLPKIFQKDLELNQNLETLFFSLKEMFVNQSNFSRKDSFNPEAAKTYERSQEQFIQKVFETTVIPSSDLLFQEFEEEPEHGFEGGIQIFTKSYQMMQGMKQKLKQICPNSFQSIEPIFEDSQKEESAQEKTEKLLKFILDKNFHYEL